MSKRSTKKVVLGILGSLLLMAVVFQPVLAVATNGELDVFQMVSRLFAQVDQQDEKIKALEDEIADLKDLLKEDTKNPPEIIGENVDQEDPVEEVDPPAEEVDQPVEEVDPPVEETDPVDPSPDPVLDLSLKVVAVDGGLKLTWTKETSEDLNGYKVVVSKNNPNPSYPDDGYLRWITDRDETSIIINNTEAYNGGDIDSYLKADTEYYFTITYLYNETKVTTPTVHFTTPSELSVPEEETPLDPSSLVLNVEGAEAGLRLSWTMEDCDCLNGYKVVISESNPTPSYPDDGYLGWITDHNENTILIDNSEAYNGGDINGYLKPNTEYYFTISYLYKDHKVTTETVKFLTPETLVLPTS
jgi:hypothetical protein